MKWEVPRFGTLNGSVVGGTDRGAAAMGQYKSRPATGSVQELWRDECRKAYRMVSDQLTSVHERVDDGDDDDHNGESATNSEWTRLHLCAFRGGGSGHGRGRPSSGGGDDGGGGGDLDDDDAAVPWDELAGEVRKAGKESGLTALHIACTRNTPRHAALVSQLLQRGADPNVQCRKGFLPAHYAAANGCTEALAALAAASAPTAGAANAYLVRTNGITPLHMAAIRGHTAEVAVLLEAEDARDPDVCAARDDTG
jgi:hypothetical protein